MKMHLFLGLFPTVQRGKVEHHITTQEKKVLTLNHNNSERPIPILGIGIGRYLQFFWYRYRYRFSGIGRSADTRHGQ